MWGISKRRVQNLCVNNRIPGAFRIGNMWAIPADASKPKDARVRERVEESVPMGAMIRNARRIIGGLIVLAAMPFVLRFANLTETGRGYLKGMLLISTYYVMGQAVNTTLIAGVFRAGGDSRFGFICDSIDMWCYAVPLGFLAAAVLKLPPMWVYFLLCTDEFVKWPWVIGHYRSKKWLRNITRENVLSENEDQGEK